MSYVCWVELPKFFYWILIISELYSTIVMLITLPILLPKMACKFTFVMAIKRSIFWMFSASSYSLHIQRLGWKAQNGCDFTDHCNRCFYILPSLSLSFSHQVCVCLFILMSVCYCLCGILLSLTKTFLLNIDVCA